MDWRIRAIQRGAEWIARAEHETTGRAFGIEVHGVSEDEVVQRLTRWLEWQSAHTAALEALQQAERLHLRAITDGAFLEPKLTETVAALQSDSLNQVDEARRRLDIIRAQRPE